MLNYTASDIKLNSISRDIGGDKGHTINRHGQQRFGHRWVPTSITSTGTGDHSESVNCGLWQILYCI